MIEYRYPEEKQVVLILAEVLNDGFSKEIIEKGEVTSKAEAIHISKFFWKMVTLSAERSVKLPFDGSTEYWIEKFHNSLSGYLVNAGFAEEWDEEVDNA